MCAHLPLTRVQLAPMLLLLPSNTRVTATTTTTTACNDAINPK
jgi:hypothetical protein